MKGTPTYLQTTREQQETAERRHNRSMRRCAKRPKGVDRDPVKMTEQQKSSLPRRCKQTADMNGRGGNGGKSVTYVQGGAGKTMPRDNHHATGFGKPKSHKAAGWVVS